MFEVLVGRKSQKFVKTLDKKKRLRIIEILEILQINPLPFKLYDMKKLVGIDDTYRIRAGQIRITYELSLDKKLIKVRYIGYRGSAYK